MRKTPEDSVIDHGIKELEKLQQRVTAEAKRLLEETTARLEALRDAGARDVFKDALVLAVGDVRLPNPTAEGNSIGLHLFDHSGYLVVAKGCEAKGYDRKFRAMLVIFEERPPRADPGTKG